MYIIAIGWAYVILMMAITASSLAKGLAIAFFLGVLPLWLFIWLAGGHRRRSVAVPDEVADQGNGTDPETDQK
jgi:hypothetical protein